MINPCPEFWERYEAANQLSLKVEQELELVIKDGKAYNIRQDLAVIDTALQGIQELWDTSKVTLESGEKMFAPHYEALRQIFMDNHLPLEFLESRIVLNESGGIDSLNLSIRTVANLNSFKYLSTLRRLELGSRLGLRDITPLTALRNLEELALIKTGIADISPLANLTKLSTLNLGQNKISDISALRNLTNLTELHLGNNQITNISPLSNLQRVRILTISYNKIEDLNSIQQLTSLRTLALGENPLRNLGLFSGLMNIEIICFRNCQVEDISQLIRLPKLRGVVMSNNNVNDLSPLTQLPQLRICSLSGNPGCETLEGKAVITSLEQRDLKIIKSR